MKARLIRIANCRGVRLPKALIEEAGLKEHVQLQVRGGTVVISSSLAPRAGWAEAARRMSELGEDGLFDKPTPTRFDTEEWRPQLDPRGRDSEDETLRRGLTR